MPIGSSFKFVCAHEHGYAMMYKNVSLPNMWIHHRY